VRALLTIVATALVAATALCAAGCGSDDDPAETGGSGGQAPSSEVPGGADPDNVQVIDDWSRTLSEGDVEGAADYFAIPSVAQNGTPPLDLDSREDVIAFNRALPCGAELVEATEENGFIVATFELTDRPGGGCGPGVGGEAKTAFVIEDGKIAEWRRAADEPVEPQAEGPVV
jgi:hypothetical protein